MKTITRVHSPPSKPLMVYDGDCRFCTLWIRRWQCATGERVDYLPSQDPSIAARLPEIPREQFDTAVQLIETDGTVYSGAEAVFRARAHNPRKQWLFHLYKSAAPFAWLTETVYSFIARHRKAASLTTRLLWGKHVERPSYFFVRSAFIRSLGIIYLLAFVSLWTQIAGLAGRNGIMPVQLTMENLDQQASAAGIGWTKFFKVPTLCWFNPSDGFLMLQCALGVGLAILLILGIAPAPCLFLLWLVYLSLATVCQPFLNFQWDILLLETGFLAIFFAPLRLLPVWLMARVPRRRNSTKAPKSGNFANETSAFTEPPRIVLWLLRWLLFKLMFQSGCVKLLSGDPTWRNLTALNFHYETQPLPTWLGWHAHQLPDWIHRSDVAMMFGIELAVPFFIFLPRIPRLFACLAFLALQFFILLTGNYCFFNLLTMVLCITLLDDAALMNWVPKKWCGRLGAPVFHQRESPLNPSGGTVTFAGAAPAPRWFLTVTVPLAIVALTTSLIQFSGMFRVNAPWPAPIIAGYQALPPFRSFNSYGLFAVMTTTRPEIVIEGSNDGVTWEAYEFKYKPGDLKQHPQFVAPHQPRLDWQMWFAALSDYRHNPWFINFCIRLLQGSPEVLELMRHNPFPDAPPRHIRAVLYEYRFTDRATRRETGEWWRRELKGIYLPPVSWQANGPANGN